MDSRIKTSEIQQKADQLSSTAGDQSNIELGHTNQTDLNAGNKQPQGKLKEKARLLANKAQALHDKANEIVTAATSNNALAPLSVPAGHLKNAAGTTSSGLHQRAEALAQQGGDATQQANEVIQAFDEVEKQYVALIAKAEENGLTSNPLVTEVVKAYHAVKNIYYQMLIGYRFRYQIGDGAVDNKILHKTKNLYREADSLANAGGLQAEAQKELKQLANGLAKAVGENELAAGSLQLALSHLKGATDDEQIATKALKVIEKYNAVDKAFKAVKAREADYKRLAKTQYTPVTEAFTQLETAFEPLKKSYVNVLRLMVEELANKSENLSGKAFALSSGPSGLGDEANALAAAASKPTNKGLKEKAEALVGAINAGDALIVERAGEVIKQSDEVTEKYYDLAKLDKYQELLKSALEKIQKGEDPSLTEGDELKVKNVYDVYTALKEVYESILNFTKIKYYVTQVETHASQITDPTTAKEVKTLIAKLEKIYNSIPVDIKYNFQSDFETIKKCRLWSSVGQK